MRIGFVLKGVFSDLPAPLRAVIPVIVRRLLLGGLRGQGMGRFIYTEMLSWADKDLSAFEAVVGDGPFLFGESIVAADTSVARSLLRLPQALLKLICVSVFDVVEH